MKNGKIVREFEKKSFLPVFTLGFFSNQMIFFLDHIHLCIEFHNCRTKTTTAGLLLNELPRRASQNDGVNMSPAVGEIRIRSVALKFLQ